MGSYRVAKHFVPLLQASPGGIQAYVVITSLAGQVKNSVMTPIAYNLSKLCNNRMAEQIHADHFEKDGVMAFAVHPGTVLTPQTEAHHTTQRGSMWTDSECLSQIASYVLNSLLTRSCFSSADR
jgi:NAD(P)-dependent dehydrogenase (short-subunit alcohol dehydrogenase family)